MRLTEAEAAIFVLVDRFVEKQRLVANLLGEIRPDLLGQGPRPSKAHIRETQRGSWNDWSYFVHGGGCRLIHTRSAEPIEWDGPDTNRFDPHWFTRWMAWWFCQDSQDDGLRRVVRGALAYLAERGEGLERLVSQTLAALEVHGLLREYPDQTNRYEWLAKPLP